MIGVNTDISSDIHGFLGNGFSIKRCFFNQGASGRKGISTSRTNGMSAMLGLKYITAACLLIVLDLIIDDGVETRGHRRGVDIRREREREREREKK